MAAKQYVVVGGSSGIGLCLAERLAEAGQQVWVLSRHAPESTWREQMRWTPFDVLADDAGQLELPETLDGVAYCPGNINLRPFRSLKPDDFRADYELNLIGAVKLLQAFSKPLQAAAASSVVLFSTVAVCQGMPYHASVAAAKGAVEGLTRSLAAEWAPAVRVNCVAPSLTDTPLAQRLLNSEPKQQAVAQRHALKRYGRAEDIAALAYFLLSDQASWITGQVIGVDGGLGGVRTER